MERTARLRRLGDDLQRRVREAALALRGRLDGAAPLTRARAAISRAITWVPFALTGRQSPGRDLPVDPSP